eukprot:scaffold54522_cov32-Tisochrysis_lutea.AAC.1
MSNNRGCRKREKQKVRTRNQCTFSFKDSYFLPQPQSSHLHLMGTHTPFLITLPPLTLSCTQHPTDKRCTYKRARTVNGGK